MQEEPIQINFLVKNTTDTDNVKTVETTIFKPVKPRLTKRRRK